MKSRRRSVNVAVDDVGVKRQKATRTEGSPEEFEQVESAVAYLVGLPSEQIKNANA